MAGTCEWSSAQTTGIASSERKAAMASCQGLSCAAGVPGLHNVAGTVDLRGRAVHRHDEVEATGTQVELDRPGVEQDRAAHLHRPRDRCVGDGGPPLPVAEDFYLLRAGALGEDAVYDTAKPGSHL
jgi:hypothetical protein